MRVAPQPERRKVTVSIEEGPFAGWELTAYADFPARLMVKLQSGEVAAILEALEAIVLEHNLPDMLTGELATELEAVDYEGVLLMSTRLFEAIGRLPNRSGPR